MAGAALWQGLAHTHSAFAWSLPFAVILLFLAFLGDPPAKRVLHWVPDAPEGPAEGH